MLPIVGTPPGAPEHRDPDRLRRARVEDGTAWRFHPTARLKIVGWILALAALGLGAAGFVVLTVESQRIDARADRNIAQELEEFDRLHRDGEHRSIASLLEAAHEQNAPQPYEVYLGIVDGEIRYFNAGPDTEQGVSIDGSSLDEDEVFLSEIRKHLDGGSYGLARTEDGHEVRFGVQPVRKGDRRGAYVVAQFTDPLRGGFLRVLALYGLVAALNLMVVAGGGWLVAGRILRPIRQFEATARDITETDLTRRLRVGHAKDDIARLARTFNAMLDRLTVAFGTQKQFLDDAGHELKTPITVLQGHLELLNSHDPVEVEETRELLLEELDRMTRLVGDLITLAKAERPDFVVRDDCSLGELTDDALRLASGLGVRAWMVDARAEGTVRVDRQRIIQAVLQLAANAVRYGEQDDVVAIGSSLDGDTFSIWVRDTGPGVSEQDAERIFDRFVTGSARGSGDGSGLGLAIVRAIAEAHDGEVTLSSREGHGAKFTLRLPADPPAAAGF